MGHVEAPGDLSCNNERFIPVIKRCISGQQAFKNYLTPLASMHLSTFENMKLLINVIMCINTVISA